MSARPQAVRGRSKHVGNNLHLQRHQCLLSVDSSLSPSIVYKLGDHAWFLMTGVYNNEFYDGREAVRSYVSPYAVQAKQFMRPRTGPNCSPRRLAPHPRLTGANSRLQLRFTLHRKYCPRGQEVKW